jgi:hypothetical protein
MDVRIPFKRSTKGMKNTDKTRNKVFGFVEFVEHFKKDTTNGLKEAIKKGAILKKKMTKFLVNSKNKVAMSAVNQLKRHFSRAINAVLVTTGRAKFRMTAERNKFKFTATWASIHGTAIRRVATMNHLLDVFHNNRARMKDIFNFFIMFVENFL